jgi:hypothetical protein
MEGSRSAGSGVHLKFVEERVLYEEAKAALEQGDFLKVNMLIAENVMSWKFLMEDLYRYPSDGLADAGIVSVDLKLSQGNFPYRRFYPSQDAQHFIEVVQRMREWGWYFFATDLSIDSGGEWWSATFREHAPPGVEFFKETSNTLCTAGCLAALKVIDYLRSRE